MWISVGISLWVLLAWPFNCTAKLPNKNCLFVPEEKRIICEEMMDGNFARDIPESTKVISFTSSTLRCDCALKSLLQWKEAQLKSLTIEGTCFSSEFPSGKSIDELTSEDIPCGVGPSNEIVLRRRREVEQNSNETQAAVNKTTIPGAPLWPCDFEEGFCQWFQLANSDFEWIRHQGPTASSGTGPEVDHTTGNTTGYYIYIETSIPRRADHKARLVSPTLAPVEPNSTCEMDLYVHMKGGSIGELNIYQAPVVGFPVKKYSNSSQHGENWFHLQVQFDSDTAFQVIIEGVRGVQYQGDIAIDDVSFTSGCKRLVPSYVRLTNGSAFNEGQVEVFHQGVWGQVCQEGWNQQDSVVACAELGFQNVTATGGYPVNGPFSGKSAVNCSSNETSINQCPSEAWSNSTTCSSGNTITLQCSGILPVCPRKTHFLCPADNQGSRKCLSHTQRCDFRNDCWDGSDETSCANYTRCDFEQPGLCGWLQAKNDQMNWTRHRNNTPSSSTGPSTDHNGLFRYYLYMEVSGRIGGEKARIAVTPRFEGDNNGLCKIRFYFHMNGYGIGTLRVYAADRYTQHTLWSKKNSQSNAWGRAEIPLVNLSSSFVVIFEAEHSGLNHQGDIAIDDVSFTPECRPSPHENVTCKEETFRCGSGECIPLGRQCDFFDDCLDSSDELNCGVQSPGRCDFESDFCHWRNVTDDDFDWERISGATPSSNTGPLYDHTRGFAGGGHYIYIEASSPRQYGDVARIVSPQFMWQNVVNCTLSFYYHMWGLWPTPGTLRVLLQNTITGARSSTLWQMSGYKGNQWLRADVAITTSWPVSQVVIEAVRGLTFHSDIAIDDISFSPQCYPSKAVHIYKNYDVRLVGSRDGSYQGRVEVYRVGTWGTICDDAWDLNDATIVCKQLGYAGALDIRTGSYFGEGKGQIWLDNLACLGNETNLSECVHNGWGSHNCDHTKDAGVICQKNGGTTKAVRLMGNSTHSGRVEIYHQGSWEAICYDGWDTHDAFVTCRQLGFFGADSIMSDTTINPSVALSNVRCQGDESSLGDCPHSGWNGGNCSYGYAGVICSAEGTAEGNIRLAGGSSRKEGRIEVFHRGEWGTICHDRWRTENARVVCYELGFTAVQKVQQNFGPGSGRVWLENVECAGNESALVDCSHNGWGVSSCPHDWDVGVICSDEAYVGCYKDKQEHVMTHELFSTVMTPVKCLRRCQTKGYKFAGLEWANDCYCGNHYDRYGNASESECNLPCVGDSSKICGGAWALSVYNTDPAIIPTSIPGYAAITQSCTTRIHYIVALLHRTNYYSGDHTSGWISTPRFPGDYLDSTVCVWVLNLLPGTQAKIHFEFFETERLYDFVEIRDGSRDYNTALTPHGGFTGNRSYDITASTNVMWIKFASDQTIAGKGFNLTYSVVGGPTSSPPTLPVTTIPPSKLPELQRVEGGCNGQLDPVGRTFGYNDWYHNSGYVKSPGYPSNYPGGLYCKWTVRVAPGYRVYVTVNDTEIAHGGQAGGLGDRLQIDDGVTVMNSHEHPAPWSFTSSDNLVRVLFLADDNWEGRGFFLSFSRVNITEVHPSTPELSSTVQPTVSSQTSSPGPVSSTVMPSSTLVHSTQPLVIPTSSHQVTTGRLSVTQTTVTSSIPTFERTDATFNSSPTKVTGGFTEVSTTATRPTPTRKEGGKGFARESGMSGGTVAGIVVPILLLILIVLILLFLFKKKKKRANEGVQRHGFVNEAYDNLESMNMSTRANAATAQAQSAPANHSQPPTQPPSARDPAVYFSVAPPPYTPGGIYLVPFATPPDGSMVPVGMDAGYAHLFSAPPAYESPARPMASATTTTGIGSVTSLRDAARDDGAPAVGLTPLTRNTLPPIRGTAANPEKQQPAQGQEAGPLPEKTPMTVVTPREPSAPPRPLTPLESTAPPRPPTAGSHLRSVSPVSQPQFDMEVPFEFLCPITNKIMEIPMTASDGYSYERKAIRKWFRKKQTSPMTNEELSDLTLKPNDELRQRIESFIGEHSSV